MIRVPNLRLSPGQGEDVLVRQAARKLLIAPSDITKCVIAKQSVDARDKSDVHFVVTVDVTVKNENAVFARLKVGLCSMVQPEGELLPPVRQAFAHPPVVVGAGPAGLFAALYLAKCGAHPILVERGDAVEERTEKINTFFDGEKLDENSNVQFGEGGAGAFSDGKLTTGIKSPFSQDVLRTFVQAGATEDILYLAKPHIGTDKLKNVVASLRKQILALGGQVLFYTKLTGLCRENDRLTGVILSTPEGEKTVRTDTALLCIGHSARDTFKMLHEAGITMEQKPFAIGVRVEHLQSMINVSQFGAAAKLPQMPAADYKLNVHTPDGRGVYTFCMCPGGYVMGATSLAGHVVTNGMSEYARDGQNANAALLCGVRVEDFGSDDVLAGIHLQEKWEKAAFTAGGGNYFAPCQRVEDFLSGRPSHSFGQVKPTYRPGVKMTTLDGCLPERVIQNLRYALPFLGRQLRGFDMPDALLTGVETRTSSPVRIVRGENGQSSLGGLYPVGEGAGYAGGIMSAACDGLALAKKAMENSIEGV